MRQLTGKNASHVATVAARRATMGTGRRVRQTRDTWGLLLYRICQILRRTPLADMRVL